MSESLPRETGSDKSSVECPSCGKSLPLVSTDYGSTTAGACPSCTKGSQLEAQKAAAAADDERGYPLGQPSEDWKVEQLSAFADERGIDLGGASKKADMVAALNGLTA